MRDASVARARICGRDSDLRIVCEVFDYLQQRRHTADYDLQKLVSASDATEDVEEAERAFQSWERIRNRPEARDYLFSLLFKDRL